VRAPIGILALTAIALLVPPETRDMLAYLHDGTVWREAAFHLALIGLGFNAWYWARAALAARFGADDTPQARQQLAPVVSLGAYTALPRILLIAAAVLDVLMLNKSSVWSWTSFGVVVVWAVLLYVLLWARLGWQARLVGLNVSQFKPQCLKRAKALGLLGAARERFWALLDRAPFGTLASAALLGLSLLIFVAGTMESFVQPAWLWPGLAVWFAQIFPGPAAALFGLGLMVGPLAMLVFVSDGLRWPRALFLARPPVLILLALWVFVVMPASFDLHTVRVVDEPLREQDRVSLARYFTDWVEQCFPAAQTVRPVIVAVSGGATMAGIWGARVLHDVANAGGDGAPAIFAVSSVSGGSLGAAAFLSLLATHDRPCAEAAGDDRAKRLGLDALRSPELAGDSLGPVLNGWLLGDIPRSVFGAPAALVRWLTGGEPRGGDSAAAIEHGFEFRFSRTSAEAIPISEPFLSLFYAGGRQRPGMPMWIANGTDAATGSRLLTVPISVSDQADAADPAWPFGHAYDVLGLLRADVPISTALNNTARFPYLEPFGAVLSRGVGDSGKSDGRPHEIIDGGYFENEGLETALELGEWLKREGPKLLKTKAVEPIIVQATASGSAPDPSEAIVRCSDPGLGPHQSASTGELQIFAPLIGLYSVRGGHSAVALRYARDAYCTSADGKPAPRFFHFYLGSTSLGDVPLNWVLSQQMAEAVWAVMEDDGNRAELDRLDETFRFLAAPTLRRQGDK
jgi:hypothetical protein